tara:strand:- start:332 stop:463 length:132 start_codon:yes stop_codon:yes gene_type:complete
MFEIRRLTQGMLRGIISRLLQKGRQYVAASIVTKKSIISMVTP